MCICSLKITNIYKNAYSPQAGVYELMIITFLGHGCFHELQFRLFNTRAWKDNLLAGCVSELCSRKYQLLMGKLLCKRQSLKRKILDEWNSSSLNFHSKITRVGMYLKKKKKRTQKWTLEGDFWPGLQCTKFSLEIGNPSLMLLLNQMDALLR